MLYASSYGAASYIKHPRPKQAVYRGYGGLIHVSKEYIKAFITEPGVGFLA